MDAKQASTPLGRVATSVSKTGKTREQLAEAMFRATADASGHAYPADAWDRMPEHRKAVWRKHAADRASEK